MYFTASFVFADSSREPREESENDKMKILGSVNYMPVVFVPSCMSLCLPGGMDIERRALGTKNVPVKH